jgi:hypothetical protein
MKLKLLMAAALVANFSSMNAHAAGAREEIKKNGVQTEAGKDSNKAVDAAYKGAGRSKDAVEAGVQARKQRLELPLALDKAKNDDQVVATIAKKKLGNDKVTQIANDTSLSADKKMDLIAENEVTAMKELADLAKDTTLSSPDREAKRYKILEAAKDRIRENCKS